MNRSDVARMRPLKRKALLEEIAAMVASGELKLGEAARVLRSSVLGMDRQTFARVVKVSPRAIAHLEDDPAANPTLETLTRVFAPFGGRPGLIFPGMEEAAPLDEDRQQRRGSIRTSLASNRRTRRAGG